MTEKETSEDQERRYLVPVARLNLPDQPDLIHLSVYQWMPAFQAWATGMAICGYSTQQGPLMEATATCPECLAYQPRYERILAPGYRPEDDDPEVLRAQLAATVAENAELKRERDVLRRSLARLADIVSQLAMFAFDRNDSRRALLRTKWRTADRVLAYASGPEEGCDCDRTGFGRRPIAGHLITCDEHTARQGRARHYGRKASR